MSWGIYGKVMPWISLRHMIGFAHGDHECYNVGFTSVASTLHLISKFNQNLHTLNSTVHEHGSECLLHVLT